MANTSGGNININNVDGNCLLLREAYMEVPIMSETSITASGCRSVQHKERSLGIAQPSPMEKRGATRKKGK